MRYDILALGATGFTGKYIAEYLNSHPQRSGPTPFTFAIAGRSQKKLEEVKRELKLDNDVGLLVLDVADCASVEAVVTQTKVVLNTIGPFWRYGDNVVRACANNGVHYVDLAGEPHFIKAIIQKYDYQAHKNNAILIPCCGFDSVPADVAVYLANKTAKSALGPSACIEDSISLYNLKGGVSGGTIASAISGIEEASGALHDAMQDYSYREPKGAPTKPAKLMYRVPVDGETWYGVVFPMCPINRLVVHHTWSLFERSRARGPEKVYGNNFTYEEIIATPNFLKAVVYLVGVSTFIAGLLFSPARWILKRILPKPGEGPKPEGFFEVTNISHSGSSKIKTVIRADGEPGYFGAARMISEAGLALALDFNKLPYKQVGGAGVLTPMAALGDVYIKRMEQYYGLHVESEVVSGNEGRKQR